MQYSQYREKIQSGDLIATSGGGKGWVRKLELNIIQSFTQSQFDHIGIAYREGDRVFLIEATPPEVRIGPLSNQLPFYHIAMNIEWQEAYTKYLFAKLGQRYSSWQALVSYFRKPEKDKAWQCAELVNDFYKKIKVSGNFGYTPVSVIDECLRVSESGLIKVDRF